MFIKLKVDSRERHVNVFNSISQGLSAAIFEAAQQFHMERLFEHDFYDSSIYVPDTKEVYSLIKKEKRAEISVYGDMGRSSLYVEFFFVLENKYCSESVYFICN